MKISLNTNHPLQEAIYLFAHGLRDVVLGGNELFDVFVSNNIVNIRQHIEERTRFPNHFVIRARTIVICNSYYEEMQRLCALPSHDVYFYVAPTFEGLEYEIASQVVDMVLAGNLPYIHIRTHTNEIPLVQKEDTEINVARLANELRPFMNTKVPTQICINSSTGNSLNEGAGHQQALEKDIACDNFINHHFKGGYMEEVRSILREKYVLGRIRLMRIDPKTNYSFHVDMTPRLHIPLVTNNQSFLLCGGRKLHLPLSPNPYIINTRLIHNAINGHTSDPRYHLVCVLIDSR